LAIERWAKRRENLNQTSENMTMHESDDDYVDISITEDSNFDSVAQS
jgi:hypothetical protein